MEVQADHTAMTRSLSSGRILGFFLRFMAVFVLLTAPWPGIHRLYAPAYRAIGNAIFVRFGTSGSVHIRPLEGRDPDRDSEFVLTNRSNGAEYVFTGTTLKGYQPTAFLLALIIATPIPWPQRWRAALWGLGCASVYVFLRSVLFLVFAFSGDNALALFTWGSIGRHVLDYSYWVVVESFAGWLILPLPMWAFLCLRSREWLTPPASAD